MFYLLYVLFVLWVCFFGSLRNLLFFVNLKFCKLKLSVFFIFFQFLLQSLFVIETLSCLYFLFYFSYFQIKCLQIFRYLKYQLLFIIFRRYALLRMRLLMILRDYRPEPIFFTVEIQSIMKIASARKLLVLYNFSQLLLSQAKQDIFRFEVSMNNPTYPI